MRPKVHHRPWQRRAVQYAAYAFWPLLLLWIITSYPGSGSGSRRHGPADPALHPTDLSSSGGAGDAALAQQQQHAQQQQEQQQQLEQPQELSDTDSSEWVLPKNLAGGAGAAGGSAAGATQQQQTQVGTIGQQQQPGSGDGAGQLYSSATIYAVRNGNGNFTKFYYKFHNVRLTKKAMYFYMPPGMKRPDEHWVDFVSGNATLPTLPTMIVIKGEVQRQKWYYMPIKYTTARAECTAWTTKPTYFLQVRYSYNIWHTWNEGLMGAFQTLREQGMLPLAQVDAHGNLREVTEGLLPECPTVWDEELNGTRPETTCRKRLGLVKEVHCDMKNQGWCRSGVVSYRRFDGPIILPYTAASVMNRWAQVYDAMSTDVRDFSLVDGHCFKSLLVGKTNTLNYYQAVNSTAEIQAHIRERVDAMAVFKAFVSTAQREFVAQERAKNPAASQFRGYANKKMERLRQGIGPEDIDLVDYIAPSEVPGLLREELPQLKQMWAKRRKEIAAIEAAWKAGKDVVSLAKDLEKEDDGQDGDDEEEEEEQARGKQQQQQQAQPDDDSIVGGGGDGDGEDSDGAEEQQAGGGKAKAQGGEVDKRRSLREREAAASGKPTGEGSRRRGHRTRGGSRSLQQAAGQADGAAMGAAGAADAAGAAGGVGATLTASSGGSSESEELELDEAAEVVRQAAEHEEQLKAMPTILQRTDQYQLETPRPVVTYMSRNFFSRGVLNEPDILRYILSNYNVTLRVTTFEEPLLQAMELLQHTDVLLGMHGAGWTNGMFIKHGAVAMQMYPYGWRLPDNTTIRGYNYREIVLASECKYFEWVSQRWDYAFFRRIDFNRRVKMEYVLHPDPNGPHPVDGWPGNPWIYQNTYVDMAHFGPYIDAAMAAAKIPKLPNPLPVTLKDAVSSDSQQ